MKRSNIIFLSLIFLTMVCIAGAGDNILTGDKEFTGDETELTCQHPLTEESIPMKITVPEGWKINPAFGTVVFQPADADEYYEPPNIEIQALCEGECESEAVPGNIRGYMQRLMQGWQTLSTGDPELDKQGAIVEVIKEKHSEGLWLFAVKLTYPEGVSSAMYPPRYYIYLFLHDAQDPYFILVKGIVPVNLADQFLSDVYASCMTAAKR